MNYIIGDIGNTSTRICILNDKSKILKSVIFDTKKIYLKGYINNILKNIGNVDNVSWGPSDDGSKYIFEIKDVNTWEKDKVVEESA